MSKKYRGHPSKSHWNVALWFGNVEGLYALARAAPTPLDLQEYLRSIDYAMTEDGVAMTPEMVSYAWQSVDEDREVNA